MNTHLALYTHNLLVPNSEPCSGRSEALLIPCQHDVIITQQIFGAWGSNQTCPVSSLPLWGWFDWHARWQHSRQRVVLTNDNRCSSSTLFSTQVLDLEFYHKFLLQFTISEALLHSKEPWFDGTLEEILPAFWIRRCKSLMKFCALKDCPDHSPMNIYI